MSTNTTLPQNGSTESTAAPKRERKSKQSKPAKKARSRHQRALFAIIGRHSRFGCVAFALTDQGVDKL